jgi:hypothetical protein
VHGPTDQIVSCMPRTLCFIEPTRPLLMTSACALRRSHAPHPPFWQVYSMSSSATSLAQLQDLQESGAISVQAYLRMVQELRRDAGASSSPTAPCEEDSEDGDDGDDNDDDDEILVGEDGNVETHYRRGRPLSPRQRPSSPAAHFDVNGSLHDGDGLEDEETLPATPAKPTGPVADDLLTWAINTKVISTTLGEVNFVRVGTELDFVNKGRAKVSFEQVARGCKRKMETQTRWVTPDTLSLPPSAEEESPTSRRVSPRRAARSPAAAEGPERAAHERERKMPHKREGAPRRTLTLTPALQSSHPPHLAPDAVLYAAISGGTDPLPPPPHPHPHPHPYPYPDPYPYNKA